MEVVFLKPWPLWSSVFLFLALVYTLFHRPKTMRFGKLIFNQGKVSGRSRTRITKTWLIFFTSGVCFLFSLSSPYLKLLKDSADSPAYAVPVSEEEYLVYDYANQSLYKTLDPIQHQTVSSSLPKQWHQVVLSVWPDAVREQFLENVVKIDGVKISLDDLKYDWSIPPSTQEAESFARWLLLSITPQSVTREDAFEIDLSPYFVFLTIFLGCFSMLFAYRSYRNH